MLRILTKCKRFKLLLRNETKEITIQSSSKRKENKKMYETVKTVKGYAITRMKNTHGCYHVLVREGKGFKEFHTFKTIKAATEFIQKAL